MRTLISILTLLLTLSLGGDVNVVVGQKPASVGGPDVWYDIQDPAAANSNRTGGATKQYWDQVTIAQAGTATKLRWYCRGYFGGSETIKMALYNGTTLMSSGSVSVTAGAQWFEVTLAVPQAVSAASYNIATSFIGGNAELGFKNDVSTYENDTEADAYTNFPPGTLPTADTSSAGALCVGVYVD